MDTPHAAFGGEDDDRGISGRELEDDCVNLAARERSYLLAARLRVGSRLDGRITGEIPPAFRGLAPQAPSLWRAARGFGFRETPIRAPRREFWLGLESELRSGDVDLVGGDPGNPVVVVDLVPHATL
jgi:hypothetical protein